MPITECDGCQNKSCQHYDFLDGCQLETMQISSDGYCLSYEISFEDE